ncbi:MAG: response regulator [Elusimicrobia bacterium]|nr:response regulator [Elusimicrobiota bacterium]
MAKKLVADDDATFISLMSDYLGQHYRVLTAFNGHEMAQLAAQEKPALIILDISMPETSGASAYQLLRWDPGTSSIPVIFVSSHPRNKVKPPIPSEPHTRYFQKPIDFAELTQAIKELLSVRTENP